MGLSLQSSEHKLRIKCISVKTQERLTAKGCQSITSGIVDGDFKQFYSEWRRWNLFHLQQLGRIEYLLRWNLKRTGKIMTAIADFATKQNAHNDKIDAAVAGVSADIQALKDLITQLQNSPGTITPEDQVTLDALEKKAGETADKLDALDQLTPPTPPTAP
jgi:hypothetical protein